ncbi:uncharacterized protein LOC134752755 [Cydia strobilella]|uniref:uncharacterized protein LOC134752755 n=1 Tax=Cydia strobilella TaxID=1100964 RepID=UPI00300465F6
MIPDPEKARKEAARPRTDDKPEKLLAPARMFVSNIIYQKLSDDPLVYAKVLVAVASSKACRALLTRGAPLQVYCLETGKLYPLEAEAKKDVSRITLTGDEEVSGVLIALATRLYHPSHQGQETEQVSDRDREQDGERILEVRDAAEHMIDACETNQQAEPAIQQPSNPSSQQDQTSNDGTSANTAHTVLLNILSNKTIQIQPCPGSTVTTVTTVTTVAPPPPLTTPRPGSGPGPGEVVELSDED